MELQGNLLIQLVTVMMEEVAVEPRLDILPEEFLTIQMVK
jgi:hypothetical protein